MSQLYCAVRSVPMPFVLRGGGSGASSVQLVAPVTLTWQSGSPDTWTPGPAFIVQPAASYSLGGPNVSTLTTNWLIVAVQGTRAPVLVKEQDYPNTGTVLGGANPAWAALYLVTGTQIVPLPQRMAGALPTPYLDNALLSVDPTSHEPYWELPNPGDLLIGSLSPVTHLPVWERLPVPSGSGQALTYEGAGVVDWGAASVPLPLAKGDILRANVDGSGHLYWERYPLTAGNEGDFLMNDRNNSGLPVWHGLPLAPVGSGAGVTKAMTLWTGSGNAAPPTGWSDRTYNDSAWGYAVISGQEAVMGYQSFGGTDIVWPENPGFGTTTNPEAALFRHHFQLAQNKINGATLQFATDGTCFGIWFNGRAFGGFPAVFWPIPGPVTTVTLDLTPYLLYGQDNVLALWSENEIGGGDAPNQYGSLAFILTLS